MDRPTRSSLVAAAIVIPAGFAAAQAKTTGVGESTFDRINRTKTRHIAAFPGKLPYFVLLFPATRPVQHYEGRLS